MSNVTKKVVILGGGTAGWFSAALISKVLGKSLTIQLVESEQISSVGVGEATIPPILNFNAALGIDEKTFLKETKGSIKLGIEFENWGQLGGHYMHAFGNIGKDFPFATFHHFWLRAKQLGVETDFWDFSLNYQAAKANKFQKVNNIEGTNLPGLAYAYHFDAGLYARYLRKLSESQGVERVEGQVDDVKVDEQTGYVTKLVLQDGQQIEGDLFIDCSGMRALLIEQTLNAGFEDWSHWLPCDRAIAVQSEVTHPIKPYTRSIAHQAGWQWRIPLQHRNGNGIVYSSKYMNDEQAKRILLESLGSEALTEPRVIPFRVGRRRKQWHKNVVAIGLSSGFLEPLESTSIHLIQSAVTRLIKCFPNDGIKQIEVDEFNRQSAYEIERIRDFIILHYKVTNRTDSKFWRDCAQMDIPQSLADKIELFKQTGKVFRDYEDLFTEIAWQQVLIGQGCQPTDQHNLVESLSKPQAQELLNSLKILIDGTVAKLSSHDDYLNSL